MQALSSRMGNRLDKVQLREAMEDMDADGSGEVDLEEFQEWFGRGKEIDAVVTELNLSSVLQSISKPGAFILWRGANLSSLCCLPVLSRRL